MSMSLMTPSANPSQVQHHWFVIDAEGKTLGRLAAAVAARLRGKHKAIYTPHADTGDYIIIINAEKIHVTGRKAKEKIYHSHTGFPGGIKEISFEKLLIKAPIRVLEIAIKGMLPKGPLGRNMYRKLKVYTGSAHPHEAQMPTVLDI